ncbi:MAG: hypothetical protein ACRDCE_22850 [Cetobacterium sp.]|uniref:hypothetical protein n=1 Tax=Cetobacterium sp. TaxID=2071632 RepID=UPI003EE5112C
MTNTAICTLLSKIYAALATADIHLNEGGAMGGLMLDYKASTQELKIRANGKWMVLAVTANPTEFGLNGRKNWRAIKALVAALAAKQEESRSSFVNEELLFDELTDEEIREDLVRDADATYLPSIAHLVLPSNQATYERYLAIHSTITDTEWADASAKLLQGRINRELGI